MDVLIALALVVVAGCMLFNKPLNFTITVKKELKDTTERVEPSLPPEVEQTKAEQKALASDVAQVMQDIMGVNNVARE